MPTTAEIQRTAAFMGGFPKQSRTLTATDVSEHFVDVQTARMNLLKFVNDYFD